MDTPVASEDMESSTPEQQELYDPRGPWSEFEPVRSIRLLDPNEAPMGGMGGMFCSPIAGEMNVAGNGDFDMNPDLQGDFALDQWVYVSPQVIDEAEIVSALPATFDQDVCMTGMFDPGNTFHREHLGDFINGISYQEEIPAVFADPNFIVPGHSNNNTQAVPVPIRSVSKTLSKTFRRASSKNDGWEKAATSSVASSAAASRPSARAQKRQQTRRTLQQTSTVDASQRKPKRQDQNQEPMRLACPFFLRDRNEHLGCLHFQLTRVKDVKQHITRKHFGCVRCQQEIADCGCRDDLGGIKCPDRAPAATTGKFVSEDQKQLLSARTGSGLSDKEQWFKIWEIVFPDVPESERPENPYLKSDSEEIISMVRQLWSKKGLEVLSLAADTPQRTVEKTPMDSLNFVDSLLEQLAYISNASASAGVEGRLPRHGGSNEGRCRQQDGRVARVNESNSGTPGSYFLADGSRNGRSHNRSPEYPDCVPAVSAVGELECWPSDTRVKSDGEVTANATMIHWEPQIKPEIATGNDDFVVIRPHDLYFGDTSHV